MNFMPRVRAGLLLSVLVLTFSTISHPPTTAFASSDTYTIYFKNVTEVVPITNPCFGPAVGVLTYDGVLHVTENSDSYHIIVNVHGNSLTVPDDPNKPSFSGSFSENQALNLNRQNESFGFVVTQLGDHGMEFHITFKVTVNAGGGFLQVFNVTCSL